MLTSIQQIPETMEETVWVLVIEHRYGFNHYVNKTKEGMLSTLASYCEEWWDELDPEVGLLPSEQQEVIDVYFDHIYEEWYTYDQVTVHD